MPRGPESFPRGRRNETGSCSWFYGALESAAVAALHIDLDTGGYRDGGHRNGFPDKAVHALAAWSITNVGVDLGVQPKYSAAAVWAAGSSGK